MEKLSQMKNKFLFKFLPKQPVASVSFQNPTLSPSRSLTTQGCRSPCMVSIIPKEARRKQRVASFSAREPTSPKVSCMGQVKCKKRSKAYKDKRVQTKRIDCIPCHGKKEKILLWMFKGRCDDPKRSKKAFVMEEKAPTTQISPSLGAMKKFASGRGSLSYFDATLTER
ncbi:uncharacterized protein At1g76070-like [Abrus precatorius]|uniref:Uncharacterized protein At1g76070-like n=1 Tax=Abrus precatorius TaxID=3816 RepID=A0A8B8KVS8_ABRPR|nr:uncharacterized protein At1g76070-like [Abrus precatorius]